MRFRPIVAQTRVTRLIYFFLRIIAKFLPTLEFLPKKKPNECS